MLKRRLLQISLYRLPRDCKPVNGLEIAQCKLLRRLEGITRLERKASKERFHRDIAVFSCLFSFSDREHR